MSDLTNSPHQTFSSFLGWFWVCDFDLLFYQIFEWLNRQILAWKKRPILERSTISFLSYWLRFIEFMTARIWASLGLRPICINIALIMFSLIGGFFLSSRLKNQRERKNPAMSPRRIQPMIIPISAPVPISVNTNNSI